MGNQLFAEAGLIRGAELNYCLGICMLCCRVDLQGDSGGGGVVIAGGGG